jgi:signal transduction histidine kinase
MSEWLDDFCSSGQFLPHGHCYLWNPSLVKLHLVSDLLITLAYISIPFTLIKFVRLRKDIPFHWMFVCFGMFIVACGATHAMEIWTLWHPDYWVAGVIKAVTAAASVPTAILLAQLLPQALNLPTPEQWRLAHEELSRAHRVLEEANAELESFSYSVAHDLRAPLRSISGFSSVLLEDWGDRLEPAARRDLDRIIAAAARMAELIDALLALARLSRTEPAREVVDLSQMARKVADQLLESDPARAAEFLIADDLTAQGDPQLLRALLENLLGNAWKFSNKRDKARIEFGKLQGEEPTTYFVRDNGAGFNMEYAAQLYAPFRRLHTLQEFEGTGVGLATVQRIVRRHEGTVWAESVEGQGATFFFRLVADNDRRSRP